MYAFSKICTGFQPPWHYSPQFGIPYPPWSGFKLLSPLLLKMTYLHQHSALVSQFYQHSELMTCVDPSLLFLDFNLSGRKDYLFQLHIFQFQQYLDSSVTQSCLTLLWPHWLQHARLPYHQLLEFTQTHVHWVGHAIQPSHPLSSPSPPALNLSQHQGLFQWVSSSHQVAEVLEFQLQHQSFQWTPRTDLL